MPKKEEESPVQFPNKGFGSVRRLEYIGATQHMIQKGLSEREIIDLLMDEGITESKAHDYLQVAQRRVKRGLQAPDVQKPPFGRPFPDYGPPPESEVE